MTKCPKCKKKLEYVINQQRGRATVIYKLDKTGTYFEEMQDFELENDQGTDCYCPHCNESLDSDIVDKVLEVD